MAQHHITSAIKAAIALSKPQKVSHVKSDETSLDEPETIRLAALLSIIKNQN
jgi:hypothetical protein